MKRSILAATLWLSGCTSLIHPVDPENQGFDHRSTEPNVFIRLGQASQICLPPKSQTAPVDIFVTLQNMPPQRINFVVDNVIAIDNLYGATVQLHLERVGLGPHHADILVPGFRSAPFTVSWSIWDCGPVEHGELYKPDGHGLKDYCNCPVCGEVK